MVGKQTTTMGAPSRSTMQARWSATSSDAAHTETRRVAAFRHLATRSDYGAASQSLLTIHHRSLTLRRWK